jgi:hypothetical protein
VEVSGDKFIWSGANANFEVRKRPQSRHRMYLANGRLFTQGGHRIASPGLLTRINVR